jgi:hypothetical protein
MLLIQPLKVEDINIHIKEDDAQQLPPSNQMPQVSPIVDMIDDIELLAILGLPPTITTSSSNTTSPVSLDACLLDWNNMPELLSDESESVASTTNNTMKRKHDNDELFALFDFEEYQPIISSKKKCLTANSNQEPPQQVDLMTLQQNEHG